MAPISPWEQRTLNPATLNNPLIHIPGHSLRYEMYCSLSCVHTHLCICANVYMPIMSPGKVCACALRPLLSFCHSRAWLQSYVSLYREHTHTSRLVHMSACTHARTNTHIHTHLHRKFSHPFQLQLWPTSTGMSVFMYVWMPERERSRRPRKWKTTSRGAIWFSIACHAASSLSSHVWT